MFDPVDKQVARINFSCAVIYKDLYAIAGEKNFPNVPDEYLGDFLRGYFDGDGGTTKLLKRNRVNLSFVCEDEQFLKDLSKTLREKCGVEKGRYDKRKHCIHYGTKDTKLISNFMYKNDYELFLKRKKDKFEKYIIKEDNI